MSITKKKIKKIKDRVEEVLRDYPQTRNSDKLLLLTIWERERKFFYPEKQFGELNLKELGKLTSLHTITRVRRSIQHEEDKYPPTSVKVMERRSKNQEQFVAWVVEKNTKGR